MIGAAGFNKATVDNLHEADKNLRKKYENKLWTDLRNDAEKYEFVLCGRAFDSGIIAKALEIDLLRLLTMKKLLSFTRVISERSL